ncbi:MAG: DUF3300 domain-containing protein [Betaproteobacteria bacterium]|nr:DUF3300 domain-containing protein [Betaproteobacteria bacterium]
MTHRMPSYALLPSLALAFWVTVGLASAQQPAATAAPSAPAAAAGAAVSQQELDQLLAPIALYPDALVAQILMASTYPLEVVEAARWAKANPAVKDKALEDAMQKQAWDPAVKALAAVPTVLAHMNENLSWTQKLGDAFLADQKAVMATIQVLRGKAQAAGNLKTTPEQKVKTEVVEQKTVYIIESAKPEVVYVPTYNPTVVYGTWWYPYPPYAMYPPAYVYPPGVGFATGVIVGAAIWGNCNWGGNNVNINVNQYNSFNKTNIQNANFQHNADHRKGVSYGNQAAAQKYGKGGANAQSAQAREAYRGREQAGAASQQGATAKAQGASAQQGARAGGGESAARSPSASTAAAGARAGAGGGAFTGAGSGASTQAASGRGAASRGGGGRR